MDCEIVVSEFELQLRYYVHFRTNTSEEVAKNENVWFIVQLMRWWFVYLLSSDYIEIVLSSQGWIQFEFLLLFYFILFYWQGVLVV